MEEFSETFLEKEGEPLSDKPGKLLKHQIFVSRFLSAFTPYDGLLLFHEMGTGKTCSAIATIELVKQQNPNQYRGALILCRGTGLINNFVHELVFKCTDGKYMPDEKDLSEKVFKIRTRKKMEHFYMFETFEKFAKKIRFQSSEIIRKSFEKYIVVIDEVHNIRNDNAIYETIHRFVHCITNKKIILLSGTPMKDGCEEIASIINLLSPISQQMPTGQKFLDFFFAKDGSLQNVSVLKKYFTGRVSFLKSNVSLVDRIDVGHVHEKMKFLKTVVVTPSNFQRETYERAWNDDMKSANIYINSRQAALFVFPDGTFGKRGFKKWFKNVSFWQSLQGKSREETLRNVEKYSVRYAKVAKACLFAAENEQISFVYSDIVHGSGLLIFAKVLELCGFSRKIRQKKAFISITSAMSENQKSAILNICNSEENWNGSQISVILGSRVVMEGFTFNNISHEHILTPHWNYSETSQIIARGWRMGSHRHIQKRGIRPSVYVYQYVLDVENSIDVLMYKISEDKDVKIKQITQILQESAVDCRINKKRNEISGFDNERECNYGPCAYKCDAENVGPKVFANYSSFYFEGSKRWYEEIEVLRKIFAKHFKVKLTDICDGGYLAMRLLVHCRENGEQFINPMGQVGYLQCSNDRLFLVTTPRGWERCTDFPTMPKRSFSDIVCLSANCSIITSLNGLLNRKLSADATFEILQSFPSHIQKMLLEKSCKSKILGKTKKVFLRELILEYFTTLYTIYEKSFGIFFETPTFYSFSTTWNLSSADEKNKVLQKRRENLDPIHKNQSGYYGQENKKIDEFCIKQVGTDSVSDKRKIQSGRRCINWNKTDLVTLCNKLMGSGNWNEQTRGEMCNSLKQWFSSNRLLEQDLTCGVQTKQKDFDKLISN